MKFGIELGIRAPKEAILKASEIAEKYSIEYLLVPETHPKFYGVNAFQTLEQISEKINHVKLGTGIVNVFSRSKNEIADQANQLFQKTSGNFVLGIGTSAPAIIEDLWKMEFKKPLSRLVDYSSLIKSKYNGPVFWAAVGQKTIELAAENADGVIFFLKPKSQILNQMDLINKKLKSLGKSNKQFEVISIVPTYFDESQDQFQARMTLAGYIGANEFYSVPLIKAGFQDDVSNIRESYRKFGLKEAAKAVSNKLLCDLTISGSPDACKEKIRKIQEELKLNTIILGFDLPKEKYTDDFFEKLDKLLSSLE
jgi:alkanesulfonate monooxygenase SsuD/methylene tetrahydromethanopterin reductase-like flavin-dependent oxidoreductase (luciferase family)